MFAAHQRVEAHVVLCPVQVGARHVHRGGFAGTAQTRVHGGTAGVGKEIQEALATGHLAQHAAGLAVIEEQAGIQIVVEVDPQTGTVLLYLHPVLLFGELLVLLFAFLTLAHFQDHLLAVHAGHLDGGLYHVEQALTGLLGGDILGRRVLLHHQVVLIAVDGGVVLRQIGVVETIAVEVLFLRPLLEGLQILAQTVGKVLCHLFLRGHGVQRDLVVAQLTLERPVEQAILLVGAQAQTAEQLGGGRKDRDFPPLEAATQGIAKGMVHFQQRRELTETLAIGRVGNEHADLTGLPFRRHGQRVFQGGRISLVEGDEMGHAGGFGVVTGFEQHAGVGITTEQLHLAALHAAFGAHLRLHHQALPQFAVMLQPAIETEALAAQGRRHVGGDKGRFNQQGTGTAHGVHHGLAGPAATGNHGRGQVLFERSLTGALTIEALVQRGA